MGQRRRTEVTLKHFRLLFLKESDPFIYRSLVCFLSRPRARAFKKFLPQSRERACVILDLSSLRIHLRIMHVETRGNLDARRQDLTRARAHVFPPPPPSLSLSFLANGRAVRVFDFIPHNSMFPKKNVSHNSAHLYRIRSNVDRITSPWKEFNRSLRGTRIG